ncbi:hypothetical protein PtB15_7B299 [Puccinia triticina]|nr:hypothetical protein PtB15_7B299 [Puccinia triticina]
MSLKEDLCRLSVSNSTASSPRRTSLQPAPMIPIHSNASSRVSLGSSSEQPTSPGGDNHAQHRINQASARLTRSRKSTASKSAMPTISSTTPRPPHHWQHHTNVSAAAPTQLIFFLRAFSLRSSVSSLISKTKARSMYLDLDVFVVLNLNSLLSLDVMLSQEAQPQHTFARQPASESVDLCNVIILMKPFAYSSPAVSLSIAPLTTTAGPTVPPSSPGPSPRPIPTNLPSSRSCSRLVT